MVEGALGEQAGCQLRAGTPGTEKGQVPGVCPSAFLNPAPAQTSQTLPSLFLGPSAPPTPPDRPAAPPPVLTALQAFRGQAKQEKGCREGPSAHDAGRVGGHHHVGL